MTAAAFAVLVDELDRWQALGRRATLWLRDDDATEPSADLDRLLELAARHGIPLTLAVIPASSGPLLARHIEAQERVSVAVHGWLHVNHAPAGEKTQELGRHRPAAQVLEELSRGAEHLKSLHGRLFVPVLVPPWNRIDASLLPGLNGAGFRALSVFGPERPGPLPMVNTHVDLIDWRGTRGGRDHRDLADALVARLRAIRARGGHAGLLTHHLVHDESAWAFLSQLFVLTAGHPACRWIGIGALIDDGSGRDAVAGNRST